MAASVLDRPAEPPPEGSPPAADSERVTRRVVLWTCVAVVAVRTIFVMQPLRSDEGGYLFAARHWAPGTGEFLYGDFLIDRPPALMMFYRLAALWESDAAIRVITIPVVVLTVVATAHAARLLGGPVAARWAAVVTAALMCSPALAADQADGELFALLFVTTGIAAILHGRRARSRAAAFRYGFVAGLVAAAAPLVKQNFIDALLFILVVLVGLAWCRCESPGRVGALAAGAVGGVVTTLTALVGWAQWEGVDSQRFWADLVTFRAQASAVLLDAHYSAPVERGAALVAVAVLSAAAPIIVAWVMWLRRRSGLPDVEHWALLVLLGWAVVGIVAGGSYWLHYLQALAPGAALAAGLVIADRGTEAGVMRVLALWAVAASTLSVLASIIVYASVPKAWYPQLIASWVAESAEEGDGLVVAYGSPQIVEAADLDTPYPYLWSLQMRTLDREQRQLERLLEGPSPPTWFVVLNHVNSWDIDDDGQVRALLDEHYETVADICGHEVMVHLDAQRPLAQPPTC
jgi:hypothetical protein